MRFCPVQRTVKLAIAAPSEFEIKSGLWLCHGTADLRLQGFRVKYGLSCVIGPLWQARAGCYSQAALSSNDSKSL